jgi:hypothetical protein
MRRKLVESDFKGDFIPTTKRVNYTGSGQQLAKVGNAADILWILDLVQNRVLLYSNVLPHDELTRGVVETRYYFIIGKDSISGIIEQWRTVGNGMRFTFHDIWFLDHGNPTLSTVGASSVSCWLAAELVATKGLVSTPVVVALFVRLEANIKRRKQASRRCVTDSLKVGQVLLLNLLWAFMMHADGEVWVKQKNGSMWF